MNKAKRIKHTKPLPECNNCGKPGNHYIPPSFNEISGFICEPKTISKCVVCGKAFKEGDKLQVFLINPYLTEGCWTHPVLVDDLFQKRHNRNRDTLKRRHYVKLENKVD